MGDPVPAPDAIRDRQRAAAGSDGGATGRRPGAGCGRALNRDPSHLRGIIEMALKKSPTPLQLARLLRGAAVDKKAWDCVVIDVRDKTSLADYFVICEGETDRQVRAIADAMVQAAKEKGLRPLGLDGYDDAGWILLDLDPELAHGFLSCERGYYHPESFGSTAAKQRDKASL